MNGLKCPQCELVNLLTAENCHRCGARLADLPQTAQVSVPIEQTFQAQMYGPAVPATVPSDNETGRKTFLWYRVYCVAMALLYLFVVGMGLFLVFLPETSNTREIDMITGAAYAVVGVIFLLAYSVAAMLPRKSYNWIVGIVVIALGLTSCCFLPATVPLLIFWLKPETKAYFGRE